MPVALAGFVGGLGLFAGGAVGLSLGWGAALAVGSILIAGTIVGVKRATELKDPGMVAAASGREIVVRSTEVPRIIVYGQAAVGGVITHQNSFGAENRSMTIEIVHTGHEIEEFVSWLFDDKEIPIADVDDINAAGDGSVDADTNSHGFGPVGGTPMVFLRGWLGTSGQTVDTMLSVQAYPGFIDSDHRHRGCARSNIRLDLLFGSEKIWDGGPPRNIRAVIRGKKVYDPRLDSTFSGTWGSGSGAHRVNTPSTWEWSSNPALCWADYRIDSTLGPGWASADIDYNSVAIAADACEVAVDIPTAATEDRFTCNGAFDTGESPNSIIGQILSSMSGSERRFKGQWHVYAGVWEAPAFTLDENDFIGTVEYRKQPETQSGDRYNLVRGSYFDPSRFYQSAEFLEVADTTLQTDRDAGRELPKELDLRAVNGEYQAQRLAYRLLAQAADSGIFVCQVGYRAANMRIGVRVEVSLDELGFSDKIFRLVNMRHVPFTGFELTLKEDREAAWDDPDEADYGTRSAAGVITFPIFRPDTAPAGGHMLGDPFFERSGELWDNTGFAEGEFRKYYWRDNILSPGSTTTQIIRTGGFVGGVLEIDYAASSGQVRITSIPHRAGLVIGGETLRMRWKIRKRDNPTLTNGFITLNCGTADLVSNADMLTIDFGITLSFADINGWTIDEWQDIEASGAISNWLDEPLAVVQLSTTTSMSHDITIEVESVLLHRIS